jgi:hypothetical protein
MNVESVDPGRPVVAPVFVVLFAMCFACLGGMVALALSL